MARTSVRDLASALLLALGLVACAADGALMARAHALALEALAALGILAWALDLRAQRRSGRRVRGLRRAGAALALAFLASAPSDAALGRRGERIATAIVEHESVHGSLPETLDELDVDNPLTRYGRWRYVRSEDGADFRLAFGDYGRDTFSIEVTRAGPPRWDR